MTVFVHVCVCNGCNHHLFFRSNECTFRQIIDPYHSFFCISRETKTFWHTGITRTHCNYVHILTDQKGSQFKVRQSRTYSSLK